MNAVLKMHVSSCRTFRLLVISFYQHAHCDHRTNCTNCYLLYLGWDGDSIVNESVQR